MVVPPLLKELRSRSHGYVIKKSCNEAILICFDVNHCHLANLSAEKLKLEKIRGSLESNNGHLFDSIAINCGLIALLVYFSLIYYSAYA